MSTGTRRLSHCTSLISKSSRKRCRSGMSRYLPSLAASLSKRMEHGRQAHIISRVETSIRCRCLDGISSPHRSQCSWAASTAFFSAFSDSSFANRRSEEKVEKAFLLPCSTTYLSPPRSAGRSSLCFFDRGPASPRWLLRLPTAVQAPGIAADRPHTSQPGARRSLARIPDSPAQLRSDYPPPAILRIQGRDGGKRRSPPQLQEKGSVRRRSLSPTGRRQRVGVTRQIG